MNIVIFGCGNVGFETLKLLNKPENSLVVIDNQKPEYLKKFLEKHHRIRFHQADATNPRQVESAYKQHFQKQKVNILITTIGTISDNSSISDFSKFKRDFIINYFGNVVPLRSAVRLDIISEHAKIIVLSSTSGHHAPDKLTAYAPSKWALESFCSSLRSELSDHKISVNVICPKTIKNKYSHAFNTPFGIDPITVARKIIKVAAHPPNSNIFIPGLFSLIHPIERIFPDIFDFLFQLRPNRFHRYRSIKIKSVLITGASSGLGKELALIYSQNCHQLYLVARNKQSLQLIKKDIQQSTKCKVKIFPLDLGVEKNLRKIVKHINNVDLLINNAGFHLSGEIARTPIKLYQQIFDVNFFSHVFLTSQLLSRPISVKEIINILSTTAIVGRKKLSAYSSSKSAFWCFSRATKRAFGNSVQITEVIPATFESSLFQKGTKLKSQRQTTPEIHAKILSSNKVARIIFNSEKQLKETVLIPALEVKIYLILEAMFPKLFRKIFR